MKSSNGHRGYQVRSGLLRNVLFPFAVRHGGSGSSGSRRHPDLRSLTLDRALPLWASVSSFVPTPKGICEGRMKRCPSHVTASRLPWEVRGGVMGKHRLPGSVSPAGNGAGVLQQLTIGVVRLGALTACWPLRRALSRDHLSLSPAASGFRTCPFYRKRRGRRTLWERA